MYRYHGRAQIDPTSPSAMGVCDRCGVLTNLDRLRYQYQFNAVRLYNTRFRVCAKCMDEPQPQLLNKILPPDPVAVRNPRPQNYPFAETGYSQPLQAQIYTSEASITDFYIDLFNGDPAGTGSSVLESITGSATRSDFAGSMSAPVSDVSTNTAEIEIVSSSANSVNVNYIAIYDAETAGALLMSAPLLNPQTVVLRNGASFSVGALQVWLNQ